jgi:hypothetical protein
MPYLDHVKENMPKNYPNSWVANHIIEKYVMSGHYSRGEELDAINIGIGCNKCVITSLSTTLNL